ncbi:MAG: hypothetical protein ACOCYP_05570 [Planctomycetota bacterium]
MDIYRDDNVIEDPFIGSLFMFPGQRRLRRAELLRRYDLFRRRLPIGELHADSVYRVLEAAPGTGRLRYVLERRTAPCGA